MFLRKSFLLLVFIFAIQLNAQEININADFVSRYVWRGLDIASTPSIQPSVDYTNSGFTVGLWGAYTLSNRTSISDEIDMTMGYSFAAGIGDIGFSIVDYYFPNSGSKFSDFKNGDGAHTLEGQFSFSGNSSFPISVLIGVNFFNDPGNNSYFELGYSGSVKNVDLFLFTGAALGNKTNPDYYGTDGFDIINVGFTVSKKIKITNDFSLPVFSSFIINPNQEKAHIVFGISIQ